MFVSGPFHHSQLYRYDNIEISKGWFLLENHGKSIYKWMMTEKGPSHFRKHKNIRNFRIIVGSWWSFCLGHGPQYGSRDGGSIDRRAQLFPQRLSRGKGPVIEWPSEEKPHGKKLQGLDWPAAWKKDVRYFYYYLNDFRPQISRYLFLSVCLSSMVTFITLRPISGRSTEKHRGFAHLRKAPFLRTRQVPGRTSSQKWGWHTGIPTE